MGGKKSKPVMNANDDRIKAMVQDMQWGNNENEDTQVNNKL